MLSERNGAFIKEAAREEVGQEAGQEEAKKVLGGRSIRGVV